MTLRCDNHVWTLTAPDGRQWTGASGLLAAAAEQRERILPEVRLQRILKAVAPTQDEIDAKRYRWIRQKSTFISWIDAGIVVPTGGGFARLECNQLDAAIDKAMAAQEETE